MRIRDLLDPRAVELTYAPVSKEDAISHIVDKLATTGCLDDAERFKLAVFNNGTTQAPVGGCHGINNSGQIYWHCSRLFQVFKLIDTNKRLSVRLRGVAKSAFIARWCEYTFTVN